MNLFNQSSPVNFAFGYIKYYYAYINLLTPIIAKFKMGRKIINNANNTTKTKKKISANVNDYKNKSYKSRFRSNLPVVEYIYTYTYLRIFGMYIHM